MALAAMLLGFLLASWALPSTALAVDTDAPPPPQHIASQLRTAEQVLAASRGEAARLRLTAPGSDPLGQVRQELLLDQAEYRYRVAIRDEQVLIYQLATQPALSDAVLRLLPAGQAAALAHGIEALRALWSLAGIEDFSQVRIRHNQRYGAPAGVPELTGFYQQAAQRYGLDWTYLAAINYIESDFGRENGPSSAGALGPMQFLPSTWAQYGEGSVMDPHDAIFAAARYLWRNGAPGNMDLAIFRYNNDTDYVDSVEQFAAAIKADPVWLERLFFWGTAG